MMAQSDMGITLHLLLDSEMQVARKSKVLAIEFSAGRENRFLTRVGVRARAEVSRLLG